MAARDAELILVQNSGPVKRFKWRPRWLAFFLILFIVLLTGAVVGGYFLYQQQVTIHGLARESAQLKKDDAVLRAQLHDARTKLTLAEASRSEAGAGAKPSQAAPAKPEPPKAKPEPPKPPEAAPKPEPPPAPAAKQQEAAPPEAKPANSETKPAEPQKPAVKEEPQAKAQSEAAAKEKEKKELLPPEPTQSDQVDVRIVRHTLNRSTLTLVYDVVNQQDEGTAEGYVTVVVRGSREDKPWIEANPPMRLSPLGRPLNYRRGTAYSVQRYRRLKATFTVADKTFERLEMLLYSRAGDLLLVKIIDLSEKKGAVEFAPRFVKG